MNAKKILLAIFLGMVLALSAAAFPTGKSYTNSIGMRFVRLEPGRFMMGEEQPLPVSIAGWDERRGRSQFPPNGDFDERPVHEATISQPFYLGIFEVTNEQYERFDRLHAHLRGKNGFSVDNNEAAIYVSWHEARAFCDWLAEREGLPYRLPTEAEWEYACRSGTVTPFSSGDELPAAGVKNPGHSWYPVLPRSGGRRELVPLRVGETPPNRWGLYDMHGNVEEWCHDWYGAYSAGPQVDPVGPAQSDFKITRGGSHGTPPYYLRSANRMGALPEDKSWFIGFRVALGDMPRTSPLPATGTVRHQQNVRQDVPPGVFTPPDPARPHFEGPKQFVKIAPDSTGPLFSWHNHHTAIAECPNGDLLALWFTTETESGREMGVAASRLRFGEREWDAASPFWDAPDRNDTGPALWYDGERTLYHFNGLSTAGTWGPLAVIMRTSVDNAVTWSKTRLILPEHRSRHQVVQSVFRTREGWLVLPCDASPSGSGGTAIHVSKDNGNTWADAGGTIAGIHAAVAQLRDGRLLAFGRGDEMGAQDSSFQFPGSRRSDPKEYRPATQSISADMGRTWTYTQGPFQPIGGGQRLVLLRLQEGPLLVVSFANETDEGRPVPPVQFTDASGRQREGRGLFTALSYDDGRSWSKTRLVTDDGPAREQKTTNGRSIFTLSPESAEPRGYLSVCQARNGVIHLLSSWNHYAFNLKWLEASPQAVASN